VADTAPPLIHTVGDAVHAVRPPRRLAPSGMCPVPGQAALPAFPLRAARRRRDRLLALGRGGARPFRPPPGTDLGGHDLERRRRGVAGRARVVRRGLRAVLRASSRNRVGRQRHNPHPGREPRPPSARPRRRAARALPAQARRVSARSLANAPRAQRAVDEAWSARIGTGRADLTRRGCWVAPAGGRSRAGIRPSAPCGCGKTARLGCFRW
jgi:hypothetical protein